MTRGEAGNAELIWEKGENWRPNVKEARCPSVPGARGGMESALGILCFGDEWKEKACLSTSSWLVAGTTEMATSGVVEILRWGQPLPSKPLPPVWG